ncbi:MAG: hypothetical protein A2977_00480 [Alphaproteobacteria bacterium RIFCSPLOWO2_01_FULL_45_8]|nr:MAG: hypothetical protein A2977_00480 [Alphaproteobacteria bacterium RIFCSPLOWO2_01_FULL_45_8]
MHPRKKDSKKFTRGFLALLVLCLGALVGAGSYFMRHAPFSVSVSFHSQSPEKRKLRTEAEEHNHPTILHNGILDKISTNLKKIFLFEKLKYHVSTGKNFSAELENLERLVGSDLSHAQFEVLRQNTEGIPSLPALERSVRLCLLHKSKIQVIEQKIVSFFKLSKTTPSQEKEHVDTVCTLIREDHIREAIAFADKTFSGHSDCFKALKNRLDAERALKTLDQIIFDGLKL